MSESEGAAKTPEPVYSLELTGNGVSVKRDITESLAGAIIALVMGGVAAPQGVSGASSKAASVASKSQSGGTAERTSVREYLNEVGPKRNAEIITAIAAFLKDLGQDTFTKDQVKEYFRKAGEPIPGNYNRDFSDAVSTGWIAEDHGNSGNYYVTAFGETALKNGFPGKIRRPAKKRVRKVNGDES